jgi:hypothetical protein
LSDGELQKLTAKNLLVNSFIVLCLQITGGGVKFLIAQCPALRDLWISPRKMPIAQVKDVMDYADSNMKRFRSVRL